MDTGSPLLFYENGSTPHRNPINQDRVRERTGSSKSGVSDWRSNHNSKGHHTLVGVSSWLYGCTDLVILNYYYLCSIYLLMDRSLILIISFSILNKYKIGQRKRFVRRDFS